jgi:hypothetical protein
MSTDVRLDRRLEAAGDEGFGDALGPRRDAAARVAEL